MSARDLTHPLRIKFNIPFWTIVVGVASVIAATYLLVPQYRNEVAFLAILIGSASGIYSAYYLGAALRIRLDQEKLERSFKILERLNDFEFIKARKQIEKIIQPDGVVPSEEQYKKIISDPDLLISVTALLGVLEDLAIAIARDYVDELVVYRSLCHIVPWNYKHLRSYVEHERKVTSDPRVFCDVEELARIWGDKKLVSTGKTVPPRW